LINSHVGHHPRVVPFLGACLQASHRFMVFHFMPFGSLEKVLLEQQQFPIVQSLPPFELISNLRTVTQMLVDASSGILHVHRTHTCHRDISARNFLVDQFHRVTVCDFGMSRVLPEGEKCGQIVGDLLPLKWCAPETLQDGLFSEKTDVYMFGIMIQEIISRTDPYPTLSPAEVADRVGQLSSAPPVAPSSFRPVPASWCPKDLAKLMTDCWDSNPSRRPTIEEVYQTLKAFLVKCIDAGDDAQHIRLAYNPESETIRETETPMLTLGSLGAPQSERSRYRRYDSPSLRKQQEPQAQLIFDEHKRSLPLGDLYLL